MASQWRWRWRWRDVECDHVRTENNTTKSVTFNLKSWSVPVFLVTNIVVFLVTMYINNCPKNNLDFQGHCVARFLGRFSFQPIKENRLLGPSSSTLTKMGAIEWDNVVNCHQAWRLFTSIWLHAGLIHLLANMLSMIFFLIHLETYFGFWKVGIIYLLSGFGGSVFSSLFIGAHIYVGASAALFGLIGAMPYGFILTTHRTICCSRVETGLCILAVIIGINVGIGFFPHVGNFGNMGGFMVGFLLRFILLSRREFQRSGQPHVIVPSCCCCSVEIKGPGLTTTTCSLTRLFSLILLIAGLMFALVRLFKGEKGSV